MQLKHLGQPSFAPTKELDTFEAPVGVGVVTFTTRELTAFCPVTHQPDYYHLTISYQPDKKCVESKSLKLYVMTFRDSAAFAEALSVEIMNDIMNATQARHVRVELVQQVRGGLELKVVSERSH